MHSLSSNGLLLRTWIIYEGKSTKYVIKFVSVTQKLKPHSYKNTCIQVLTEGKTVSASDLYNLHRGCHEKK